MMNAHNFSTCPVCGGTTFYGFSTVVETYRLTPDGPQVTETDSAGAVERLQCATCEAELDMPAFFDTDRVVVRTTDEAS